MNCNTNRPNNLRLIDGTLAITAIREIYLDKEYTSAKIITREGFTYGRFEIRAALPKGKMLRPAFFMQPETFDGWAKNGQIDIMDNNQDDKLGARIHFSVPAQIESNRSGDFSTPSNLNDFHTYIIEWNESEIKWFFDDINHLTIKINRKLSSFYSRVGEPFDEPFRLVINLGIGGNAGERFYFPNQILSLEDVINWKCSLLIDYVRIYKWENGFQILSSSSNEVSVDKICKEITPKNGLNEKTSKNSSNEKTSTTTVIIVSIISSFLLLVLISIIVFLLIRQTNLKRINGENNENENNIEIYDDICDPQRNDAIYTHTEYNEPYEEIADTKTDRNYNPNLYLKINS